MKLFQCSNCDNLVYFENISCEKCGNNLGYLHEGEEIISFPANSFPVANPVNKEQTLIYCTNHKLDACNWLVSSESENEYC